MLLNAGTDFVDARPYRVFMDGPDIQLGDVLTVNGNTVYVKGVPYTMAMNHAADRVNT